jgi:hypothetical protein
MRIEKQYSHNLPGFTPGNEQRGTAILVLSADSQGEELALEALGDYLTAAEEKDELGAALELLLAMLAPLPANRMRCPVCNQPTPCQRYCQNCGSLIAATGGC